ADVLQEGLEVAEAGPRRRRFVEHPRDAGAAGRAQERRGPFEIRSHPAGAGVILLGDPVQRLLEATQDPGALRDRGETRVLPLQVETDSIFLRERLESLERIRGFREETTGVGRAEETRPQE